MADSIATGLGEYSKAKYNALINVRHISLMAIREALFEASFSEVSTASLVNIAGSCENPYASFKLNYYGRDAHLSQSAQLQLEALVLRLHRPVFTINNSFREENFDDPEMRGRRLSEFTLIEPEAPMIGRDPEQALSEVIRLQETTLKYATQKALDACEAEIALLGGKPDRLRKAIETPFARLTYDEALERLNAQGSDYAFGHDLDIRDERKIMDEFGGLPTFVTHFPASIKFFNMMRTQDKKRVYSVDLLMPRLGETVGGAVRETDGALVRNYLADSKIAEVVEAQGGDVEAAFSEYLKIFDEEEIIIRGGFGIGFERFVGFILDSNDILETIAYRSMVPG